MDKKEIFSKLERNKYVIGAFILGLIGFVISMYCWDCFNLLPELGRIRITFPLENYQLQRYKGPLFLTIPFILFFGKNLFAVRMASSFITCLTVILTFFLGKKLFDKKTGIIAAFFLVLCPFFILIKNAGYIYVAFFSTLVTLTWMKFIEEKTAFWASVSGFVMGLGVYQKFSIGYIMISLAIATGYYLKDVKEFISNNFLNIFLVLIFFSLGVSHYFFTGTEGSMAVESVRNTIEFSSPKEKIQEIMKRTNQFKDVMFPKEIVASSMRKGFKTDVPNLKFPYLDIIFYLLTIIAFIITSIKGGKNGRFILIIFLTTLFLFTFIPRFSPEAPFQPNNMVNLIPFYAIVIGFVTSKIFKGNYPFRYILIGSLVIFLLVSNLMSYNYYFTNVSNETWIEKYRPEFAMTHYRARKKANELIPGFNFLSTNFVETGIETWSEGLCRSKEANNGYGTTEIRTSCNVVNNIDCNETEKIVIPYPPYKKDGSKIWLRDVCRSDNINQTSCSRPFIFLEKMAEKRKIQLEVIDNVYDSKGKKAYSVLKLDRIC